MSYSAGQHRQNQTRQRRKRGIRGSDSDGQAKMFDTGRARAIRVTTANKRAAMANAVRRTRTLRDNRRHVLPTRLQLTAGYQSTSLDAGRHLCESSPTKLEDRR